MVLEVRTLHAVMFEDLKLTCFKVARISGSTSPTQKTFYLILMLLGIHSRLSWKVAFACLRRLSILPESLIGNANTKPRPDNNLEHF